MMSFDDLAQQAQSRTKAAEAKRDAIALFSMAADSLQAMGFDAEKFAVDRGDGAELVLCLHLPDGEAEA